MRLFKFLLFSVVGLFYVEVDYFGDFYRFSDPLEWEDAGFRDIFASRGLKLAEWPDKAAGLAPQADAAILLEVIDAQQRCATLRAFTARGQALLRALLT